MAEKKWRILIDRACGVLRLSMLDPRLTEEDCDLLEGDLRDANLWLRADGIDLEDFVRKEKRKMESVSEDRKEIVLLNGKYGFYLKGGVVLACDRYGEL